MLDISPLVNIGGTGLSIEQIKLYASAQNIKNINNVNYVPKQANFSSLLNVDFQKGELNTEFSEEKSQYLIDQPNMKISLDAEVLKISNAELRYEVISQIIQRKFGVMELVYGAKK